MTSANFWLAPRGTHGTVGHHDVIDMIKIATKEITTPRVGTVAISKSGYIIQYIQVTIGLAKPFVSQGNLCP